MKSAESIKNFFQKLFPRLWDLIKAIWFVLFESFINLFSFLKENWLKDKNFINRISTIITWILLLSFFIYWLYSLYNDVEKKRNKNHYEEVLLTNYEEEINSFFEKYNERYKAKDCWFMRKVWSDEAMYDKYWRTEYSEKDFSCEWFRYTQNKILIPVKIEPITKTDNKYRVKWELMMIKKNDWWPYYIDMVYFELWKLLDWDLWHFVWNPKWQWPTKVDFKKTTE